MKKPHKSKAHKPQAKRRHGNRDRRHGDSGPRETPHRDSNHSGPASTLAPHSTRRATPAPRPDPRRNRPRRQQPVGVYRRPSLLPIESTADRRTFRVLLLPFVLMALALAVVPSLHVFPTLRDLIAATPISTAVPVGDVAGISVATPPLSIAQPVLTETLQVAQLTAPPQPLIIASEPMAPARPQTVAALALIGPDRPLAAAHPALDRAASVTATQPAPTIAADTELPPSSPHFAPSRLAQAPASRAPDLTPPAVRETQVARQAPLQPPQTRLALLSPSSPPPVLSPLPPIAYQPYCPVAYGSVAQAAAESEQVATSAPFGQRLAAAAAAQTAHFVIYDDKYRQIARTGGDVPPIYGVCTDVIVRAYRTLGVDLQALVQASRVGAGDPNIDHRRTETLRRYFARYGQSLPVSPHGEDYQPGDIVTYWRPQNSGSRSHIAIVAATLGPSGRPMIIHNRGWGPQLEDGLFVDRITGHYRYDATARPPLPPQLATAPMRPIATAPAATPITLRVPNRSATSAAGL